jgi:hypothetical protein
MAPCYRPVPGVVKAPLSPARLRECVLCTESLLAR